jgi:hypothetical protein
MKHQQFETFATDLYSKGTVTGYTQNAESIKTSFVMNGAAYCLERYPNIWNGDTITNVDNDTIVAIKNTPN